MGRKEFNLKSDEQKVELTSLKHLPCGRHNGMTPLIFMSAHERGIMTSPTQMRK